MSNSDNYDPLNSLGAGAQEVTFADPMSLLHYLEEMVEGLLEQGPAYAVVQLEGPGFMQIMSSEQGQLRLESNASFEVIAAKLGFSKLVQNHEHIASANIPAEWPARDKMAAETMMRLAVDVHKVQFPATAEIRVDEAQPWGD